MRGFNKHDTIAEQIVSQHTALTRSYSPLQLPNFLTGRLHLWPLWCHGGHHHWQWVRGHVLSADICHTYARRHECKMRSFEGVCGCSTERRLPVWGSSVRRPRSLRSWEAPWTSPSHALRHTSKVSMGCTTDISSISARLKYCSSVQLLKDFQESHPQGWYIHTLKLLRTHTLLKYLHIFEIFRTCRYV